MPIISASRRTDIPAFFSGWFMERVREGFFLRINPCNKTQVKRISLAPEDVDAIVFWSKNPGPLIPHLDELDARGYRYYFQFTINPYTPPLEPNLPPLNERIETFLEISGKLGPSRVIWRYDPVILSSSAPVEWHLERMGEMAAALGGATERLVLSFLDFYGRASKRLDLLAKKSGITFLDIASPEKRPELERLACGLRAMAESHGLKVFTCAEEADLSRFGIQHASCIDGDLIGDIWGIPKNFRRDRSQRPACRCAESVDMGTYGSCGHGCVYCYAAR